MNSTTRRIISIVILIIFGAILWYFLQQCGPVANKSVSAPTQDRTPTPEATLKKATNVKPEETHSTPQNNVPPAKEEIDNTPPVQLTASEVLPNVAKCVTRNFPAEARPYVKQAVVTVRLIVDKYGNVRSDTPIDVQFGAELEEDMVPAMRKLFIQAGSHAFGAKKCPPHVVNGQNVGYAIEVPLKYTP